jgi:hypothetical protein
MYTKVDGHPGQRFSHQRIMTIPEPPLPPAPLGEPLRPEHRKQQQDVMPLFMNPPIWSSYAHVRSLGALQISMRHPQTQFKSSENLPPPPPPEPVLAAPLTPEAVPREPALRCERESEKHKAGEHRIERLSSWCRI